MPPHSHDHATMGFEQAERRLFASCGCSPRAGACVSRTRLCLCGSWKWAMARRSFSCTAAA